MKNLFGFLMAYMFISANSFAGSYTWTGATSSSWSVNTNWSPNGLPGASDSIIINSTSTNLVLTSKQTVKRLTINSDTLDLGGDTLEITGSAGFLGGKINNGVCYPQATGLLNFAGTTFGAELKAKGQIKLNGCTFNSTAYFEHTGSAAGTGTGGNTFNGTTTLKNAGTSTFQLAGSNSDTFNGNLYLNNASPSGSAYLQLSHGATSYFNGNIEIISSTTYGVSFSSAGNGASNLASGKTISIGSGGFVGSLIIRNFTQNGSTSQTLSLSGTLNVMNSVFNGALTATSGSLLLADNTFYGICSFTKTAGTNDHSTGGNHFYNDVSFTNSTSTTHTLRLSNTNGDEYEADVTLNTSNGYIQLAYSDTSIFKGDISINHTKANFNSGTGYFQCSGSLSQSFSGSADYSIGKLILNKSSNGITLQRTVTIDSMLTLTSGIIYSDSTYILTLKAGSTRNGGGVSSYVDGPMKKIGNTSFVFPIGENGAYFPLEISAPSNSSNAYVAEYKASVQSFGSTLDTGLKVIDNCQHWNLYRTSGTSVVTAKLSFGDGGCEMLDSASLRMVNWDGTKWRNLGNGGISGTSNSGTIVNNASIATYGHLTLGYANCQMEAYVTTNGDSAKARTTHGTSTFSYLWSTTATDSIITGLNAGTLYSVTVTDSKGCTATASFSRIFNKLTSGPIVNESNNSYYASWGDYDNDNDLDLFHSVFFAAPSNTSGNNLLFQNNCNGALTRVQSIPGGIVSDGLTGTYSRWVDINNDGNKDLYVGPGILYGNSGDGSFSELSNQLTSLPTYLAPVRDCGFADYDNDGLLDAYLGHGKIYKNDGDNDFTELTVSAFSGIASVDRCDAVAWADYDNDGFMDVLVTSSNAYANNYLFHNEGDGTFTSITSSSELIQASQGSYGCAWGDIDNDKDLDLWLNNNVSGDKIFINDGSGNLQYVNKNIGTGGYVKQAGATFADIDNDGDLDLFVPTFNKNYLFINDGAGNFTKDSIEIVGSDVEVESYSGSFSDFDNDGDLDLFVPTAFNSHPNDLFYTNTLNPLENSDYNFIKLSCVGTETNIDAIGARIYVKASINGSSKWQMREVNGNSTRAGESGGLSAGVIHFGLGDATIVDSLKIYWPVTNTTQIFTNIDLNEYYKVLEDSDTLIVMSNCLADIPNANMKVISGRVYYDVNIDCDYDTSDRPIANVFVKASPGNYYTVTNDSGFYYLKVPDGVYNIDANFDENNWDLQSCITDSVYEVSTIGFDTINEISFPQTAHLIPCNGDYSVSINPIQIDQTNCPSGLTRGPCPDYHMEYCFDVVNNTQWLTSNNTQLVITFPVDYEYVGVISTIPAGLTYSISAPSPFNVVTINLNNPIGIGSTIEICLDINLKSTAVVGSAPISAVYTNAGGTGNLVVNGDFDACNSPATCGFTTGYATNCTTITAGSSCVSNNNAATFNPAWSGAPSSNPNHYIVDGVAGTNVWTQNVYFGLNTRYTIEFDAININSLISPFYELPSLICNVNGNVINTGNIPFSAGWVHFTGQYCMEEEEGFVPVQIILDPTHASPWGNDFAIDNISVTEDQTAPSILNEVEDCSCDPNNLIVIPEGCGDGGNITKNQNLKYLVNFHNIGTGSAHDIVVVDDLSTNLDLTSIKLLSSSHEITDWRINPDRKLIVEFDSIELEPDSMGYFYFSINPVSGLDDGAEIINQAGIYFDNNDVVITNITLNTLYDNPYPISSFEYNRDCFNPDMVYDFIYTGGSSGSLVYSWQFEDGTPSTSSVASPSNVEFSSPGYKQVTLEVSKNGCSSYYSDSILISNAYNTTKDSIWVCHSEGLLLIDLDSLSTHLTHGDCVGECGGSGARILDPENKESELEIKISPNPNSGQFNILITGMKKNDHEVHIMLYSMIGNNIPLNLVNVAEDEQAVLYRNETNLNTGIYLLKVISGNDVQTQKLVVE